MCHNTMPMRIVSFLVPLDAVPGDKLQLSMGGHRIAVVVPDGAAPGSTLQIGVDAPMRAFNTTEDETDEGSTYTSGEEGECDFGPTMLTPSEWRRRYPTPSPFRTATRAYRTHHFHNQSDANLCNDVAFAAVLDSPINSKYRVERVEYAMACEHNHSFDKYCVGESGAGQPVIMTHVPNAQKTMDSLSITALTDPSSPLCRVPVRICKEFTWGKQNISGRLPLQDYFHLVTKHSTADVPFYVFEDRIGGQRHTRSSYQNVDEFFNRKREIESSTLPTSREGREEREEREEKKTEKNKKKKKEKNNNDDDEGRNRFSELYEIPSLFRHCMLCVPYSLRPRSTDGVLLIGCRRSGSYPHVDPSFTAAWNWMLDGVKRWCLFPPHVSKSAICGVVPSSGSEHGSEGVTSKGGSSPIAAQLTGEGAAYWWSTQYPMLRERADELGMLEVLQKPGELIYVPAGWWHAVINVTEWTVAVTHNLIHPRALSTTFEMASKSDPLFAKRWWRCLRQFSPDAAQSLLKRVDEGEKKKKAEEKETSMIERCLLATKKLYSSSETGMYNGVFDKTVAIIDLELRDDDREELVEMMMMEEEEEEEELTREEEAVVAEEEIPIVPLSSNVSMDRLKDVLPTNLSLFGNLSSSEEDDEREEE